MEFEDLKAQIESKYAIPKSGEIRDGYNEWLYEFKKGEVDGIKDLFREDFNTMVDMINKANFDNSGGRYYSNIDVSILEYSGSRIRLKNEARYDLFEVKLKKSLYKKLDRDDISDDNVRNKDEEMLRIDLIKYRLIPFINKHLKYKFEEMEIPEELRFYYNTDDVNGKSENPNSAINTEFKPISGAPDRFIAVAICALVGLGVCALYAGSSVNV